MRYLAKVPHQQVRQLFLQGLHRTNLGCEACLLVIRIAVLVHYGEARDRLTSLEGMLNLMIQKKKGNALEVLMIVRVERR